MAKLTLTKEFYSIFLSLLLIFRTLGRSEVKYTSIIKLNDGSRLFGKETVAVNGRLVNEFLGIPFAEPPIGRLRFRPPIPKRPWKHVLPAVEYGNSCHQTPDTYFGKFQGADMWNANTNKSEDCLYLNVWVPGRVDPTRSTAVMVWIFGGGFWSGTASLDVYDGKILSTEENVIIVSMNYRVTVFGFLYLARAEAPGNMGLLDQLEALKWVRENIHHFGGSATDVTIFGESAGAVSVSMHVLSPLSQPYFKRAILQSGSALAPWAMEPPEIMLERALFLSEGCNCNVTVRDARPNFDKLLDCLLGLDPETILSAEWVTFEFNDFPWTPVVDHYMLVEEPRTSLLRGNFKRSELLVGSNFDESIYFIIYHSANLFPKEDLLSDKDTFLVNDATFEQATKQLLPEKIKKNPIAQTAVLFEYKDWSLPATARGRQQALDKMLGDYHFTCSVNEFAELYEDRGGPVYYYYFTHRSSQQTWPKWMGVLHGYEINFVFGEPLDTQKYHYTEEEKELARRFMRYWANFARTG